MRELTYTLLELERESRKTCDFCSKLENRDNHSVRQIVTRIKTNGEYVSDDVVCEICKEKFENNELAKCERCGRLQTRSDFDFGSSKYICYCIKYNENLEEELSASPPREGMAAFYERQINGLREELVTAEEALEIEREEVTKFQEKSEEWSKRQKQELLDKISQLEKKNRELEEQNKQLKGQKQKIVPEELINQIKSYEKEIAELKKQLEQANQQLAQIEVPVKRLKTS